MFKKQYCEYCGTHVNDDCDCLRELAEYQKQQIEDYENSPLTHAGWAFEDRLYTWRSER